ncbi:hypothetical protein M514_01017 [Trichuris suis]|uniref:Uncharacterized protein n=1 Tax=Trichuris suis TaxID=68888 RepID=A0A085NM23_9BILA|nr:hypothetical protein M513_01017 [Trichuris suis]KFD70519.1 hypothetical protein M514_01017 [Trichuris suis]
MYTHMRELTDPFDVLDWNLEEDTSESILNLAVSFHKSLAIFFDSYLGALVPVIGGQSFPNPSRVYLLSKEGALELPCPIAVYNTFKSLSLARLQMSKYDSSFQFVRTLFVTSFEEWDLRTFNYHIRGYLVQDSNRVTPSFFKC